MPKPFDDSFLVVFWDIYIKSAYKTNLVSFPVLYQLFHFPILITFVRNCQWFFHVVRCSFLEDSFLNRFKWFSSMYLAVLLIGIERVMATPHFTY